MSAALPSKRPTLAPFWLIVMLGIIVIVGLVLIYPQSNLERRLLSEPRSDLSSAYVNSLLRQQPDNSRLRLLLAKQQVASGQFAEAKETLAEVLKDPDTELQLMAKWVQLDVLDYGFHQKKKDKSADLAAQKAEILGVIKELAKGDWTEPELLRLAMKASEFGDSLTSVAVNKKIAALSSDSNQTAAIYERAAREALAGGDYRGAAELYMLASQNTKDPLVSRRDFHNALRVLQSGNMPAAALELGEREIGALIDDEETLFLLTNLARAAGRPESADRWVRKLLKIALMQQWRRIEMARAWGEGAIRPVSRNSPAQEPGIPFDDKTYTLGYQVFLENKKLEDAWQVAASAIRQSPDSVEWRERLARVSEWTSRPAMALEHWLALAQQTKNKEAWQAVLRLAPGLFNDRALLLALEHELASRPNDKKLLTEITAAYERLGAPKEGLALLERMHKRSPSPDYLEQMAILAERAGMPDAAMDYWRRVFLDPRQATPKRAVQAAVLAIMHGRSDEGMRWLQLAQAQATQAEEDIEYWRLLAGLAELQQKDQIAINAFGYVLKNEKATQADYKGLIRVLTDDFPLEAARVSSRAWKRFDDPGYLVQALTLYSSRNLWKDMGQLLETLDPNPEASRFALKEVRKLPEFLRLAGLYKQNKGLFAEARRDFEDGLVITPNSEAMRQAMIWLFIDSNDAVSLRKVLASKEAEWSASEGMHDTLASAYMALSQPQIALTRYLNPRVSQHRNDFLWLMNFADALDQNQQSDRAWRLRRQLLSEEWQSVQQPGTRPRLSLAEARKRWLTEDGMEQVRRIARARLLLTQRTGDVALDALRELLRLDQDADKNYSNTAAETAIGWLQDAGQYDAERGFLWHQYARSRSERSNRPLWAEITVALSSDDKAEVGQLLEKFDERLPRYDRVNSARMVHDLRLAQTAAFETQDASQDADDPLHIQLTENLLEFSDHAGGQMVRRRLVGIDEFASSINWHVAVDPRLSLDFSVGRIARNNIDPQVMSQGRDETFTSMRINWKHLGTDESSFEIQKRESLTSYTSLQFEHTHRIDNRLSLRIGLGSNLPTAESIPLRVAGMKDQIMLNLRYQPTRLDSITLERVKNFYQLQTGGKLGSSNQSTVTLAHLFRQEAPDLELSVFWSHFGFDRQLDLNNFTANDAPFLPLLPVGIATVNDLDPGYFLPESFNFKGIRLATDMRYETQYTRGIRPYGAISRTWHSQLGKGYDIRLGVAGSAIGADHLSLTWGLSKGGTNVGATGLNRDTQMNYRLHF